MSEQQMTVWAFNEEQLKKALTSYCPHLPFGEFADMAEIIVIFLKSPEAEKLRVKPFFKGTT